MSDASDEVPMDPVACRELWVAVIEDAVNLAQKHAPIDVRTDWGRKASLERRRAYLWLTSPAEGVRTFRWVCSSLGYDADAAQERVLGKVAA